MKRFMSMTLGAVFMLAAVSTAMAQGTLSGSKHDFSAASWIRTTGDLCQVCHTPHAGRVTASAPLWDHAVTAQTFQTYTSSTLNATVGAPDAESAVCLGCHDGQTALNAYGATPYPTAVKLSDPGVATNSNSITGTDLTNDHPVSFTFDNTLYTADGTLKDPATGSVSALLRNSKVQCSSCHDPHGKVGLTKFLRVTMANSALCTTCHNK